tara:strand:- start:469 stop:870 length:402 start_codon:yes stop_codon:yes gene_type:complete
MIKKEVLKIALNTDNYGSLKKYTHYSKKKNSMCGDEIQIFLKIYKNKIIKFNYKCEACVYCQASASLLSRKSNNKTVSEVKTFLGRISSIFNKDNVSFDKGWKDFEKIINKKNFARKECLLLPIKTTLQALNK